MEEGMLTSSSSSSTSMSSSSKKSSTTRKVGEFVDQSFTDLEHQFSTNGIFKFFSPTSQSMTNHSWIWTLMSLLTVMVSSFYLPALVFLVVRRSIVSFSSGGSLLRILLLIGRFCTLALLLILPVPSSNNNTSEDAPTTTTSDDSNSSSSSAFSSWLSFLGTNTAGNTNSNGNHHHPHLPGDYGSWPPPAFIILAVMTIVAFIVHPDGPTWILLGKLRDFCGWIGTECWKGLEMLRNGTWITYLLAGTSLAGLILLVAIMYRIVFAPKLPQPPQLQQQQTQTQTNKSKRTKHSKKKKYHGRNRPTNNTHKSSSRTNTKSSFKQQKEEEEEGASTESFITPSSDTSKKKEEEAEKVQVETENHDSQDDIATTATLDTVISRKNEDGSTLKDKPKDNHKSTRTKTTIVEPLDDDDEEDSKSCQSSPPAYQHPNKASSKQTTKKHNRKNRPQMMKKTTTNCNNKTTHKNSFARKNHHTSNDSLDVTWRHSTHNDSATNNNNNNLYNSSSNQHYHNKGGKKQNHHRSKDSNYQNHYNKNHSKQSSRSATYNHHHRVNKTDTLNDDNPSSLGDIRVNQTSSVNKTLANDTHVPRSSFSRESHPVAVDFKVVPSSSPAINQENCRMNNNSVPSTSSSTVRSIPSSHNVVPNYEESSSLFSGDGYSYYSSPNPVSFQQNPNNTSWNHSTGNQNQQPTNTTVPVLRPPPGLETIHHPTSTANIVIPSQQPVSSFSMEPTSRFSFPASTASSVSTILEDRNTNSYYYNNNNNNSNGYSNQYHNNNEDEIEADLQELGGQMAVSILDF